jgi:hypothetical protein
VRGLKFVFAALAATTLGAPRIVLSGGLPPLARIGQSVTIEGRIRHAPAGAWAALQTSRPTRPWSTVAKSRPRSHGHFTIRWRVPASEPTGPVSVRVAALDHGRVVAHTSARPSAIGPAAKYCDPPVPPAVDIPVGDGWIEGGLYLEGGAFPGILECEAQPYTIRAESSSATIVASEAVAGGHSYTLVVPAGSYALRSSGCGSGSVTVTAGKGTTANAYCPLP